MTILGAKFLIHLPFLPSSFRRRRLSQSWKTFWTVAYLEGDMEDFMRCNVLDMADYDDPWGQIPDSSSFFTLELSTKKVVSIVENFLDRGLLGRRHGGLYEMQCFRYGGL